MIDSDKITSDSITINANVNLFQSDKDPVVDPKSVETLENLVSAPSTSVTWLDSDVHGIVYRDIDDVQQKICASIL